MGAGSVFLYSNLTVLQKFVFIVNMEYFVTFSTSQRVIQCTDKTFVSKMFIFFFISRFLISQIAEIFMLNKEMPHFPVLCWVCKYTPKPLWDFFGLIK